ncbi:unnamed protein product [Sphenostylis stenocarpa]|uniref:Uncharacterized protein n=1 Tax=Sphenostylis stenocarpa TaxID=92480 RepID=A0AA86VKI3_9FABA|nr:unnamed protein product [Sphenostylis stenocarpa]
MNVRIWRNGRKQERPKNCTHSTARLHQQMKKPIADLLIFRRLLHPLAKCGLSS